MSEEQKARRMGTALASLQLAAMVIGIGAIFFRTGQAAKQIENTNQTAIENKAAISGLITITSNLAATSAVQGKEIEWIKDNQNHERERERDRMEQNR